jgi:hypothetical protein
MHIPRWGGIFRYFLHFAHLISTARVATSTYTVVPLEKFLAYFHRFPARRVFGGLVGSPSACSYSGHHFVPVSSQQSIAQFA